MKHLNHDLVGSLYAIKGMAEVHLENLTRVRDRGVANAGILSHEWAEKIKIHSERAIGIIERLRNPGIRERESPYSTTQFPVKIERKVSLQKTFEEVIEQLKETEISNGVEFLNRVPDDFPLIISHGEHLREILFYISENALQAMEAAQTADRKVILRAYVSCIYRDRLMGPEERTAMIHLVDTGPGIEPHFLHYIFDPFFTTKTAIYSNANGLGLYLTRSLVEQNGGTIYAETFPGKGTCFGLTFPICV